MKIINRNGHFHMKRRVPRRFGRIEPREQVWVSLGTDSRREAEQKVDQVWNTMISAWEARLAGDTSDAEARFEAARDLARSRGFRFLPVDRVAKLPADELVDRLEAIRKTKAGKPDMIEAAALLGVAAQPEVTVSRALDLFWDLTKDRVRGKSTDQLRIWRNGRKKAVANFIEVIGDVPLHRIDQNDMLDFREWWWRRIEEEGLTINSANKDIGTFANIIRTVDVHKRLGLTVSMNNLMFKDSDVRQRPSFSEAWIRDVLLAPGALATLNGEARAILIGMVNTGYRPSEGAGLTPEHIHLEGAVPFIEIRPVGRTLKSKFSQRTIPLTGCSLEAIREYRGGFPRYMNKPGLSAVVNKYLRVHLELPSPRHTMYCLRHSFEDRLLHADVDDRIRRDLLGHRLNRERYGEGASIEKLHEIVSSVAI